MEPIVKVSDLKVHFSGRRGLFQSLVNSEIKRVKAVDGVSFDIVPGEALGLAGESGCGKTTTAKTLVRLYKPTAGEIQFERQNVAPLEGRELREFRSKAQMVFQDPYESLNPRFKVKQILIEPLEIHGLCSSYAERMNRVMDTLNMVGLKPPEEFLDRFPHEMSGGQRQRVAIARALVLRPKLLVADEPVSMLDVSIRAGILNLLSELIRDLKVAGLYISHDLSLIRYVCQKTAIMYLGRIVEIGPTEEIIREPRHPYSQALLAAVPVVDLDVHSRIEVEGEAPNPIDVPSGCRFHPRCKKALEICRNEAPPMVRIGNRSVECHLYV